MALEVPLQSHNNVYCAGVTKANSSGLPFKCSKLSLTKWFGVYEREKKVERKKKSEREEERERNIKRTINFGGRAGNCVNKRGNKKKKDGKM